MNSRSSEDTVKKEKCKIWAGENAHGACTRQKTRTQSVLF